jgi:hypothetical protein
MLNISYDTVAMFSKSINYILLMTMAMAICNHVCLGVYTNRQAFLFEFFNKSRATQPRAARTNDGYD